jgi:hypothetical protein
VFVNRRYPACGSGSAGRWTGGWAREGEVVAVAKGDRVRGLFCRVAVAASAGEEGGLGGCVDVLEQRVCGRRARQQRRRGLLLRRRRIAHRLRLRRAAPPLRLRVLLLRCALLIAVVACCACE